MSIVTKKGDEGKTELLTGQKVSKDHDRVEAYGTLDELQSALGLARSLLPQCDLKEDIKSLQHDLIAVAAELAAHGESNLIKPQSEADINKMEKQIESWEKQINLPQKFIPIGDGHPASAALDLGRTISRRLERRIVPLYETGDISRSLFVYINRLSDYLFMLSHAAKEIDDE